MDIPAFRIEFPEFSDTSVYTDTIITKWSNAAECELSTTIFGCSYTLAIQLYTAHNITLAAQNVAEAASGGAPGTTGGSTQSMAVGTVSISYDTTDSSESGAGFWNQTEYGRNLYRMIRKHYGQGCVFIC